MYVTWSGKFAVDSSLAVILFNTLNLVLRERALNFDDCFVPPILRHNSEM